MKIPQWLKGRLSASELDLVAEAVKQAEKKTSAEIVPVLVRRSSTVGHVPFILFLLFSLFYFVFGFVDFYGWEILENTALTLTFLVLAAVLSRVLASFEWIERWVTPKIDQEKQVWQRAQLEFYQSPIKKTQDSTGVLLFLSLMERQAVVLADQGVSAKFSEETWQKVMELMVSGVRSKNIAEGLCRGIEECGELLGEKLPIHQDDRNELPNQLMIYES